MGRNNDISGVNLGADYTPEEEEFLRAYMALRKRTGKRYPAMTEILAMAKDLGYRKVAALTEGKDGSPRKDGPALDR